VGELYRTTGDITASFINNKTMGNWTALSVISILDKQIPIRQFNGPNHWNDPDMLEVGNGMSYDEDKSHFSLWCMLAAPLCAGNDLRKMSVQTNEILTNKEMIFIDQDSLGITAFKMMMADSLEVLIKPLKNNALALCFLNRTGSAKRLKFKWSDLNISDHSSGMDIHFKSQRFKIRDVWIKKNVGTTAGSFEQEIASHAVVVLKLEPVPN
jgi:alpha-galactosidase